LDYFFFTFFSGTFFSGLIYQLDLELGVLRQFDFSSELQRMSVIVKNLQTGDLAAYVKGSPEILKQMANPDSSKYFIFFFAGSACARARSLGFLSPRYVLTGRDIGFFFPSFFPL
jgi:magnesium-transporting ATPase (P-type)